MARSVPHFLLALLAVVAALVITTRADAATLELDYAENATNVTVTATGSPCVAGTAVVTGAAVSYDGATPVVATVTVPGYQVTQNDNLYVAICDGTTAYIVCRYTDSSGAGGASCEGWARFTPTAGSHTIRAVAYKSGGTVTLYSSGAGFAPIALRVALANPTLAAGGSSTLGALTDVDDSGKATGSVLKYRSASGKWEVNVDNAGAGGVSWSDLEPWLYVLGAGVWFVFGGVLALIAAPMMERSFRWWRA